MKSLILTVTSLFFLRPQGAFASQKFQITKAISITSSVHYFAANVLLSEEPQASIIVGCSQDNILTLKVDIGSNSHISTNRGNRFDYSPTGKEKCNQLINELMSATSKNPIEVVIGNEFSYSRK